MTTQELLKQAYGALSLMLSYHGQGTCDYADVAQVKAQEALDAIDAQPKADERGSAEPDSDATCNVTPFSSRMCERGVKGCIVVHTAPARDGSEPGLREALQAMLDWYSIHGELQHEPTLAQARAALAATPEQRAEPHGLKAGNTALLEALMDMVLQHCCGEPDDFIRHGYLSSNEAAVDVLEQAGMIENDRLNWPALQRRKDELAAAPPAAASEQRAERNFCERCGKRLGDGVHTCTPPGAL